MNQTTVAERFNAASASLEQKGHRVIVRRARLLLEGGKADEAVSFLEDAGRRMRGLGVDSLAADLRAWREAGGDPGALVTDPEWVKGAATDHVRARVINQLSHGAELGDLVDVLVDQRRALAAGEPLAGAPAARVAPDRLPPLPRMGIKKERANLLDRPVVEPIVELPRDIEPEESGEAQGAVSVARTPPPAATSDEVLKLVSQPAEDFSVSAPISSPSQPAAAPPPEPIDLLDDIVELSPSPLPDTPQPPATTKSNAAPLALVVLIIAAAIAAGFYFLSR